MLEHAASDRVEHSVEELDGFGRGVAAGVCSDSLITMAAGVFGYASTSATLNNNQPLGVVDEGFQSGN